MTLAVDDPLIEGMTIARPLPLHESNRRLRALYPECPRMYGVAVMADVARRRWWPLRDALTTDRLALMFASAAAESANRTAAAHQIAATLAHVVVGRVLPLVMLEGRAWDTGLENLWVHADSEGAIDWVGVVDPTVRALPDDPFFEDRTDLGAAHFARDGMVRLPSEAALTTWVAHRSHRALHPLFETVFDVSGGAISTSSMWNIVGAAVVGAATHIPLLARSSELKSMFRGQAVLDALVGFGLPVRGGHRPREGKGLLN